MLKKRFLVLLVLFIQISLIFSSFHLNIPNMPKILMAMGENGDASSNESVTPLVTVISITQNPARIVPGDTFSETFSITNAGDVEAKMVQLSISVSYPFAVMETSSNFLIGDFKPREGRPIIMRFSADEDALVGVYSIPFTIKYKNSTGESYVEQGTFGVQIFGEPQLQIDSIMTDPSSFTPGQDGLMTVRLTNVGTDVTVDATMRILGGNDIVSNPLAYIAKIDSKQSESILFPISVDGGLEPAVYLLNLTVTYKDRSNSTHHLSKLFEFKVLSSRPFIPQFYLALIIGGIVIVSIGYFIYAWKTEELSDTSSHEMGSARESKSKVKLEAHERN